MEVLRGNPTADFRGGEFEGYSILKEWFAMRPLCYKIGKNCDSIYSECYGDL